MIGDLNRTLSENLPEPDPGSTDDSNDDWVIVARIVRPQGRHGEVLAELLTDFPDRFAERKQLFLLAVANGTRRIAARAVDLENHWLHHGRIVLKFSGSDSMNDAETLRGLEVAIPKTQRAPLEEDAVYISDLIGCVLIDSRSQAEIGAVSDVDRESTANALLVVESKTWGQVLVPFAKAYRPSIDIPSKKIVMELPEGLIDMNTPPATGKTRTFPAKTETLPES